MTAPITKPRPRARKCPICGRPPDARLKPFCSKRCAEADLARWLKGGYAIPGRPMRPDDDDEESGHKKPQ
ncbi:MAG: DNA gyrase inhibitor YacG [Alphaproteobacteria bacterium]